MTRILIVDDDDDIRRTLRINLNARDYDVTEAPNGEHALETLSSPTDLILLDLGLPDLSGIELVTRIRSLTMAPIIVLSGRNQSTDKIGALDAGANDYVTKPFGIDELLARIRANTRTSRETVHQIVQLEHVTVDLTRNEITLVKDRSTVHLTPTEWKLLTTLLINPDRLISKRELLTTVWGPQYTREDAYLRLFIAQLRRKLETSPARPRHLITEPVLGYRFAP